MRQRWDRRARGGRRGGLESREVSRFGETEPSTCLFKRTERRDGETDGRKRWPCLLPVSTIMSDDQGETGGGRGAERGRATHRGERHSAPLMNQNKCWSISYSQLNKKMPFMISETLSDKIIFIPLNIFYQINHYEMVVGWLTEYR